MEKTGRVVGVKQLADGVRLVAVRALAPDALDFRAGQFISVRCGEGGDVRRSYTIVSSPAARAEFELLVKDVDGGVGTGFFAGLALGAELHFTGPMGFFVADPTHAGDVVLVATGVGIAAALPVAEEIVARASERGRVLLRWGLLDGQPSYWEERLAALAGARFSWTLTRGPDWPAVHAALAADALALLDGLSTPVFYTVGNGDMIRRLREGLVARGLDRRRQFRNEVFYPVMEGMK